MKLNLRFVEACQKTEIALDGVIEALTWPPTPPQPDPRKTVVTYQGGTVEEYLIEGEVLENSIPNKTDAIKIEFGTLITSIGSYSFADCSMLSSVIFSDNVIIIDDGAFINCDGLLSITIPNNVTKIGDGSFAECSELTSVSIGNNINLIGPRAFFNCTKLTSITCLAQTAPLTDDYAFGTSSSNYTGRDTYSFGINVLKIPQGSIGYETIGRAWKDTLLDSSKCGFHIEPILPE